MPKSWILETEAYLPSPYRQLQQFVLWSHQLAKQDFPSRCVAVTVSSVNVFRSWWKEILLAILVFHWDARYAGKCDGLPCSVDRTFTVIYGRVDATLENISALLDTMGLSWLLVPFQLLQNAYDFALGSGNSYDDDAFGDRSSDEGDPPPPLMLDPQFMHVFEQEHHGTVVPASPMVFDRVYGLIPQDVQQLWANEATKREAVRQEVSVRRKQAPLPPVRYSECAIMEGHGPEPEEVTYMTVVAPQPIRDRSRSRSMNRDIKSPPKSMNILTDTEESSTRPDTSSHDEQHEENYHDHDHDHDVMMVNQSDLHRGLTSSVSPMPGGAPLWEDD